MSSLAEHDRDQRALSGEPTNNDRALWANTAVSAMALETMYDPDAEDQETLIGDLLCNLRHLCDAEGLNFDAINAGAGRCYSEEISEQDKADCDYADGESDED
jgi:hypothetical protein